MNGHDDTPAAGRPTATALRRTLKRAANGVSLDVTEAAVPLRARGPGLTALTGTASRTEDAGLPAADRPGVITYSRRAFPPITRLCRDRCHYRTLATTPARLGRAGEELSLAPAQMDDGGRAAHRTPPSASAPGCPSACQGGPAVAGPE
ncbi:hypothetical protein ACFRR7_18465 [Streptomyces sp. NPDC056909]|uniref:hypothetical protein n=1 Tax=Streptomyces sp. NPDC056909 TaxID=3345963 RepID=UPI0036B384EB